jgi:hypothetical protein
MSSEWCPRCQAWQSTHVSTSHRQETDEQGHTIQITTHSYHCATCGTILHSEDMGQPSEDHLDESGQEE